MRRDQLLIFEGDRLLSGWMGGGGKWIGYRNLVEDEKRREETKQRKKKEIWYENFQTERRHFS